MLAHVSASSHGSQPPRASPRLPCPSPSHLSSTGFPPIPGLAPAVGTEEDAVAATLAAAQKLASSEDPVPAEEEEDEVWLRPKAPGVGWGE